MDLYRNFFDLCTIQSGICSEIMQKKYTKNTFFIIFSSLPLSFFVPVLRIANKMYCVDWLLKYDLDTITLKQSLYLKLLFYELYVLCIYVHLII